MATYYVDGAVGNDGNAGTGAGSGNAWATIAHALATMANGDIAYVKASATYSIGTGLTATVGDHTNITRLVGYTTTPGDNGQATVQATAAITGLAISATGAFTAENLILDGNNIGTVGVTNSGTYANGLINCVVKNWTSYGINTTAGSFKAIGCEITGCGTSTSIAVYLAGAFDLIIGCAIHGNTAHGIHQGYSTGYMLVIGNRVYGNTAIGIVTEYPSYAVVGNTVHNNGSDGILMAYNMAESIRNNILTSNGGYGINNGAGSSAVDPAVDYNWFGSGSLANTSGARNGILAGPHDLSGDPQYVNTSAGNFTPQNSAVQAAFPSGWIGAVQPVSSGSGTIAFSPIGSPFIRGL